MNKKIYNKRAKFSIPISMIAVSFGSIFIRFSNSHPIAISFYRLLFSCVILAFFVPTHLNEIKKLDKKEWMIMMTTGFFLSIHFSAWISSLSYTSVASSVVLVSAHPIVVAWISGWHLGEKTSKKVYLFILTALFGVVLMTFSDYTLGGWALFGDILAIIGMLAVGGYIIRGRELRRKFSTVTYAFLVYGFSTIFLGIFSIGFSTSFKIYPTREYILFFALALIPHMFGHTLYNWALKYVRAKVISVSLLGEPIGATILAFLILDEIPPTLTLIGAVITLIGIYFVSRYD